MKILHINRNYIFNKLNHLIIKYLVLKDENSHEVFVPTSFEQKAEAINEENVMVCKCFSLKDKFFYFNKQKKIFDALNTKCNIENYNLIHAYTLFTDGNCAYNCKRKYGIPYVVAIRNTDINDFLKKIPFFRKKGIRIMENAERIFFLSNCYKKIVCEKYVPKSKVPLLQEKMIVIPNGVDAFWLQNKNSSVSKQTLTRLKNKEVTFIYAGRIDKNKNIESSVHAIELLQKNGYKISFLVVGKNEDNTVLTKIMDYPFVKYLGCLEKENLITVYRKADIFIMPSLTESFGLSYVEAMTQGLPVIYTRNQGFDGQFAEGIVGFHVNPKDVEDIYSKILMILLNYAEISNNCLIESDKYNWDVIADKYIDIYHNILSKRG